MTEIRTRFGRRPTQPRRKERSWRTLPVGTADQSFPRMERGLHKRCVYNLASLFNWNFVTYNKVLCVVCCVLRVRVCECACVRVCVCASVNVDQLMRGVSTTCHSPHDSVALGE